MAPTRGRKLIASKSKRSGLLFPVARVHRLLRSSKIARASHISVTSAVYLTAVLEYLTSELMDLAGSVTKTAKYKTISPRFIMLAVHSDEELLKTLSGVTIPFSGSSPFIHPVLLPKKKPQRKTFGRVKAKVLHSLKMPFGQALQILQTDIAELNVDAVINPTNEQLYMGGMVGSRLMAVGGPKFAKVIADARSDTPHLQKLDAFVTKGTGTKAKNVIHVNGPIWDPNKTPQNLSGLSQCIQNCLKVAERAGFTSIAFPSVGSGKANFPKAVAAETIVGTIKTYLAQGKTNLTNISFVLFDQASIDAYAFELNRNT